MHKPLNTPLPSISVLRCFEAAARHESFTDAAQELGMTQGALSRQVKELENHVGSALFLREGRGVRLSQAGRLLAQQVGADLDALRATITRAIAGGADREVLTIAAPPTFAARWLVPRLKAFKATRPALELYVLSRSEPFDLLTEKVDVAIHFGQGNWPGAAITPLCPENLVAVAAPSLIPKGSPLSAEVCLDLPLLHNANRTGLWPDFLAPLGPDPQPLRTGSYFDQISLIISAAVAGMGAAILPTYLIEDELRSGALVKLAPVQIDTTDAYYIARPSGLRNALAKDFGDWLRKQVSTPLKRQQG
ncbi:LysR substrate-binding domain-containing protein [Cognatishimia maritima]|uniref:DNA-binding transcriptional regulator, LysR family n=1 Tax=Cognatishimia maritima TaxID=870908 RepID=A0A1M5UTM0_9RHOB|nr:LysR substrate-binding domain-containing protein [Cognatishimia maritima]SHH66321.1 DNA-binding transcriptional regulator, LysR family [Cognatishimia maritima]